MTSDIIGAVTAIKAISTVRHFLLAQKEDIVLGIDASISVIAAVPLRGVIIRVGATRAVVYGGQDDQLLLEIGERRIIEGIVEPLTDIGESIVVCVACAAIVTEERRTA